MSLTDAARARAATTGARRSGLLHRTSLGTIAQAGSSAIRLALQFALLPILARLVGPSEYGLVALALPIVLFVNVLADGGMSVALGRRVDAGRDLESTAFWLGAGVGGGLAVVCALAAWPMSLVLHQPRLAALVLALSPILLLNGLAAAANGRIVREGRFALFAAGDLISATVGGGVAVAAALHGMGAWSLVAQQLALWICKFAFVTATARPQVGWRFRLSEARGLLGVGLSAVGAILADFISRNVGNLIIGAALGVTALGYYAMAYQVVRLPDMLITGPLYIYIFTAVAKASHRDGREAVGVLAASALRTASAALAPLFCGLAIVADIAVPLVLGDKWHGAIAPMRWLSLAGFFFCMCGMIAAVLMGMGRAAVQFRLSVLLSLVTVAAVWASARYGAAAVAAVLAGGVAATCGIYLWVLGRELQRPPWTFICAFAPALAATAVMAAVLIPLHAVVEGWPRLAALIAIIAAGATSYLGVLLAITRKRLIEDARAFARAQEDEPALVAR